MEKVLSEYGIQNTEENIHILECILKKWQIVRDVKDVADFRVKSVFCKDVDSSQITEEFKISSSNPNIDGLSLYSGDTQYENDRLPDLVCRIFHNKDCADTRYKEEYD